MTLIAPGPMTPRDAFSWARAALSNVDPDGAALDARLFTLEAWGQQKSSIHLLPSDPGSVAQMDRLFRFVRRRLAHEPTAYILGRREFWSLSFIVSPAVLIPRPDSETVVRHALDLCADDDAAYSVLDLGTGSACLLLSVLHERRNALGLGVDADEAALAVATRNAVALGLNRRTRFQLGDWGAELTDTFDLIVCNPPYIGAEELSTLAPDVRYFEPAAALTPGSDPLAAYARIIPQVPRLLRDGGVAVFEAGRGQAPAIAAMMAAQGLEIVGLARDLANVERSVAGVRKKTL